MGHRRSLDEVVPVLEVRDVAKRYTSSLRPSMRHGLQDFRDELRLQGRQLQRDLRDTEFFAVKDVTFTLRPGGSMGVLGRNGAGKSTLLRILAGISKPDHGEVVVRGRVGSLLDTSGGFNPVLTGRENVQASCHLWGVPRDVYPQVEQHILDFADLGDFVDAPLRTYSKGMRMRLGFAAAVGLTPDLLLVDEVLAVGDMAFQRKCANHIRRFLDNGGALVLVTHSILAVQAICREGLVLEDGMVIECSDASSAVRTYAQLIADHESLMAIEAAQAVAAARFPEDQVLGEESTSDEDCLDTQSTGGVAELPVDGSDPYDPDGSAVDSFDPFLDRPATFGHVVVSDGQGGCPQRGGRLVVEVLVKSNQAATGLTWTVLLYSADGALCIAGDQMDPDVLTVSLDIGLTILTAHLENLMVAPGMYALRMVLQEPLSGSFFAMKGMDTPATSFEIVGPPPVHELVNDFLGSPLMGLEVHGWRVE